jgi:hypothetical protein
MDPAAFGTAHIGLEAIRRREAAEASDGEAASRRRHPSTTRTSVRASLAAALRAVADAVDARPSDRAHGT